MGGTIFDGFDSFIADIVAAGITTNDLGLFYGLSVNFVIHSKANSLMLPICLCELDDGYIRSQRYGQINLFEDTS